MKDVEVNRPFSKCFQFERVFDKNCVCQSND